MSSVTFSAKFLASKYGETFPDNGEISFVGVAKWSRQNSLRNLPSDQFPGVTSLLYRKPRSVDKQRRSTKGWTTGMPEKIPVVVIVGVHLASDPRGGNGVARKWVEIQW